MILCGTRSLSYYLSMTANLSRQAQSPQPKWEFHGSRRTYLPYQLKPYHRLHAAKEEYRHHKDAISMLCRAGWGVRKHASSMLPSWLQAGLVPRPRNSTNPSWSTLTCHFGKNVDKRVLSPCQKLLVGFRVSSPSSSGSDDSFMT